MCPALRGIWHSCNSRCDLTHGAHARNAREHTPVSKSYCPFCKNSKAIFDDLKVEYHADELDQMPDGAAIQDELAKMTGQRTVPSIFIGGVHVGGNDSLEHAKSAGKLPKLFESAGINREL